MTLDDIRPFIAIELQGCPFPIMDSAIQLTVRDFLRRSETWREHKTVHWADPLDLATENVVSVLRMWDRLQKREIRFMPPEQLYDHGGAWQQPGPNPVVWSLETPNHPRVYPVPVIDLQASRVNDRIDVFLVRNVPATGEFDLPARLWDEHEDAFRSGSLARLMKIPGRTWSDPQRAGIYGAGYEAALARAKSKAEAGYGRPTRVVRYGGY